MVIELKNYKSLCLQQGYPFSLPPDRRPSFPCGTHHRPRQSSFIFTFRATIFNYSLTSSLLRSSNREEYLTTVLKEEHVLALWFFKLKSLVRVLRFWNVQNARDSTIILHHFNCLLLNESSWKKRCKFIRKVCIFPWMSAF